MIELQRDNDAVDSSNLRTSVTALTLIIPEQKALLPVMSISLAEGGHILPFLFNNNLSIVYTFYRNLLLKSFKLLFLKHPFYLYIFSAH